MNPVLNQAQLHELLQIVSEHCRAWLDRTGRTIAMPRDMIDFLVDSREDDGFWTGIARWQQEQKVELETQQIRAALPEAAFPAAMSAEQCLVALGVSELDSQAIVRGVDEHSLVQSSVEAAFATLGPHEVAQQLEQLASDRRGAAVAGLYAAKLPVKSKRTWVTAVLIGGGFLFLLAAAGTCAASAMVLYKGVTF
ncbi:MAG: hypothetical protein HY898_02740 [Deltaproteobacteria bacterium]|nr:hypothetical protein [Deltaproteobacteria bacterium]